MFLGESFNKGFPRHVLSQRARQHIVVELLEGVMEAEGKITGVRPSNRERDAALAEFLKYGNWEKSIKNHVEKSGWLDQIHDELWDELKNIQYKENSQVYEI